MRAPLPFTPTAIAQALAERETEFLTSLEWSPRELRRYASRVAGITERLEGVLLRRHLAQRYRLHFPVLP